jgi:hypothetical protein
MALVRPTLLLEKKKAAGPKHEIRVILTMKTQTLELTRPDTSSICRWPREVVVLHISTTMRHMCLNTASHCNVGTNFTNGLRASVPPSTGKPHFSSVQSQSRAVEAETWPISTGLQHGLRKNILRGMKTEKKTLFRDTNVFILFYMYTINCV